MGKFGMGLRVALVGPVLAAGLAGCGGGKEAPKPVASCIIQPDTWRNMPPDDPEYPRFAEALGVSTEEIRHGLQGQGVCDPPIRFEQTHKGDLVTVEGYGWLCLAVYTPTVDNPQKGQKYPLWGVVCPSLAASPTARVESLAA